MQADFRHLHPSLCDIVRAWGMSVVNNPRPLTPLGTVELVVVPPPMNTLPDVPTPPSLADLDKLAALFL